MRLLDQIEVGEKYIYVAIAEDAMAGEFLPTGIVTEADVNGPTLTLGDTTGDWTSQVGLPVAGPTNTADGIWDSYDGNEATLSSVNGRWIGANGAGTTFEIAPKDGLVTTVNEAYGKLQIVGDKARVNAIQMDDPGFINVTAQDYTIEFPSVFATGNDPDTDLPEGTSISAIVKAENIIGESIVESNTVMPQLPNPEGAAGPITATTETELTVGASVNLDGFVDNDSLVMVDETGAVTSYSPETSAITGAVDVDGTWGGMGTFPSTGDIRTFAYNDTDTLMAGTYATGLLRSQDNGETWTNIYANSTHPVASVAYGDNVFVWFGQGVNPSAGTYDTTCRVSTDKGDTWTNGSYGSNPSSTPLTACAIANNRCLIASQGTNGGIRYSDGPLYTGFTAGTVPLNQNNGQYVNWNSIAYGDGKWILVGQGCLAISSDNGETFTPVSSPNVNHTFSAPEATYFAGKLIVTGNKGNDAEYIYSDDAGATWKTGTSPTGQRAYLLNEVDGKLYWGGNDIFGIWASGDGITWYQTVETAKDNRSLVGFEKLSNNKWIYAIDTDTAGMDSIYISDTGTGKQETELTLTDNQDFKNLKAGDTVEAVPVSSYALSPAFSTTLWYWVHCKW